MYLWPSDGNFAASMMPMDDSGWAFAETSSAMPANDGGWAFTASMMPTNDSGWAFAETGPLLNCATGAQLKPERLKRHFRILRV